MTDLSIFLKNEKGHVLFKKDTHFQCSDAAGKQNFVSFSHRQNAFKGGFSRIIGYACVTTEVTWVLFSTTLFPHMHFQCDSRASRAVRGDRWKPLYALQTLTFIYMVLSAMNQTTWCWTQEGQGIWDLRMYSVETGHESVFVHSNKVIMWVLTGSYSGFTPKSYYLTLFRPVRTSTCLSDRISICCMAFHRSFPPISIRHPQLSILICIFLQLNA